MKVLQSLHSPEQRAADWFSVGAVANEQTKKALSGNVVGASDDGLQDDSDKRLARVGGGTRNHQSGLPRHLDYGECEDGSNQGVLLGMSWNSNLMSQEGK